MWDTANFAPAASARGALMMRPVMTNNVATATAAARDAAAFSLYPNPAHGTVTRSRPRLCPRRRARCPGPRWYGSSQPPQAGHATLPLPTLPPGLYTVRLTLADGRTVGRRLMLEVVPERQAS